jgi:N-acetylglucosamine malate deacetylase 2
MNGPGASSVEVVLDLEDDYRFRVGFGPGTEEFLVMDEPPPLGEEAGPNAARVLAAAVGDCLSASLLFCLRKARVDVRGIRTVARASMIRNEKGRLRVGDISVSIHPAIAGDTSRIGRCLQLFEDYCVVTESVRRGLPVAVQVKPDQAFRDGTGRGQIAADALPRATHVLAVVAHPDDESFGLGAVLDAFVRAGSMVSVLSLTRGAAGQAAATPDLAQTRTQELASAAAALGIERVGALDYPDGALASVPLEQLALRVHDAIASAQADLLVVFDKEGVTSHPDHQMATKAAVAAAPAAGLPVLAWTLPEDVAKALDQEFNTTFVGRDAHSLDVTIEVDRSRQWTAITRHYSQTKQFPVVARRLQLLGNREHLRWLVRPGSGS